MSEFTDYDSYDAIGMADLVRRKEIYAADLCEKAINRIEERNPLINAVVTKMYDQARKSIDDNLPDGPFKGVPFLLKDLGQPYAGVPMTKGCRGYQNYIPEQDSELVRRFKNAGLVILGKTNTPEFGLLGITEPELHGPTRNPWNTEHTPGGSSGGSAAAVASGMVPVASANDGGGSIRIPASYCGIFGLKPSRGRVPTGPESGESWQGASVDHVVSKSVRDSAAMLDAIQGVDVGAPYTITPPERPYRQEVEKSPGKLRIAFCSTSPLRTAVHPECEKAVQETAKLLQELGHLVEEDEPSIDGIELAKSFFMMYFGEMAADLDELQIYLKRRLKNDDTEILTRILALMGNAYTAGEFVRSMRWWNTISRSTGAFFQRYDVYLTPTVASPPVEIGEFQPPALLVFLMKILTTLRMGKTIKATGVVEKGSIESLAKTPFTQLANITGQPAMSVPLHWTAEGLPCGVQLIGRFGDEATLFRLAAQLEKARPWFNKRPIIQAP